MDQDRTKAEAAETADGKKGQNVKKGLEGKSGGEVRDMKAGGSSAQIELVMN
jgi:hypothetical protein